LPSERGRKNEVMKMNTNDDDKIKTALLQMLVMMFTAIGGEQMTNAINGLNRGAKNYLTGNAFEALSKGKDNTLTIEGTPHSGKIKDSWYKFMANTIGLYYGISFYEVPKGRSGFNKSQTKAVSIAILQHCGLIDDNNNFCFMNEHGQIQAWGNFLDDHMDLFSVNAPPQMAELSLAVASVEADEFADFEEKPVIKASDSVNSFDALSAEAKALYPLTGLVISFFEMLKTCGSAVGTILNYRYVSNKAGQFRTFRPSEGAKAAIKEGKKTYRNKAGQLKELKCITNYRDNDQPVHLSLFGYSMGSEVVLKALGFNYNNVNNVFYHMRDNFFGESTKMAMGFVASAMRLIINAVENGAPANEVGVGFSQYLNDDDIWAIIDAYTDDGEFYETLNLGSAGGRGKVTIDPTFDDPLA
jgi:hypothetical protein